MAPKNKKSVKDLIVEKTFFIGGEGGVDISKCSAGEESEKIYDKSFLIPCIHS